MNGQYLKQETSLSDICKFIYFEVELKPCHHVVSYALRNATAPHWSTVASVSGGSNVEGN